MLSGFDHITLAVSDLSGAVHDYSAVLGAGPTYRGSYPELGVESGLFGFDNGLLELAAPLAEDPRGEGLRLHIAQKGQGPQALAFATDDAAAASKALRAAGVRATPPQTGEACGGDGATRSFVTVELSPRATRGISILLVQRSDRADLCGASPVDSGAVHALDHIVLRTSDMTAAKALYGDALGLRLALEKEVAGAPMMFFRHGGVTLEVIGNGEVGGQDQLWGVAYRVRDIDRAYARLHTSGVQVSEVRDGNKAGTRVLSVRSNNCETPSLILQDPSRG